MQSGSLIGKMLQTSFRLVLLSVPLESPYSLKLLKKKKKGHELIEGRYQIKNILSNNGQISEGFQKRYVFLNTF